MDPLVKAMQKLAARRKKKQGQFGIISGPEDRWMKYAFLPGTIAGVGSTILGAVGSFQDWRHRRAARETPKFWKGAIKWDPRVSRIALAVAAPLAAYKAYRVMKRSEQMNKKQRRDEYHRDASGA